MKNFQAAVRAHGSNRCKWYVLLAASLILWSTAACSRAVLPRWLGGPAPTPTPTPVRVTAELEYWQWVLPPAELTYQQQLLATFQEQNPSIAVTLHTPDNYARRLRTALGTDRPPDVIALNLAQLPDLVAAGELAPLTTELLADQDLYAYLRTAIEVDGRPYCYPLLSHTLALFYNRTIFDAADIAPPDASWQWADLQAAATALTVAETGQFGLVLSPDFSRWLTFLHQAGGAITTADGKTMAVNTPEAIAALEFYSTLVLEGNAAQPTTVDSSWPGEAFATGKAAMVIEGNWLVPFLSANAPELSYGIAPLAAGPAGNATIAFSNCLAITNASAYPQAAEELVAYLGGMEALAGWLPLTNALPARRSISAQWRETYPQQLAFIEQTSVAWEWQLPAGFQPWLDTRNDELRRIFGGFIPADALLQAAESDGNERLQP